MPADWWDSPTAVVCPLSRGAQSARAARRLTRNTLRDWGLAFLAEDAEAIVGEFVANALTHAAAMAELPRKQAAENLGLRLFRRTGEVICAVLDPSDSAPVLKAPGLGRGVRPWPADGRRIERRLGLVPGGRPWQGGLGDPVLRLTGRS